MGFQTNGADRAFNGVRFAAVMNNATGIRLFFGGP
jgi:hypothetical protein